MGMKRRMIGGKFVDMIVFTGQCDMLITFLNATISGWASVEMVNLNFDNHKDYLLKSADIVISYKKEKRTSDKIGVTVSLLPGHRLCVCGETRTVFALTGDTDGIVEELVQPCSENKTEHEDDTGVVNKNEVAKKKPRLGTPLTELTASDMTVIVNTRIKDRKVSIVWDDVIDGDGDKLVVYVGDLLDTDEVMREGRPKYLINPDIGTVCLMDWNTVSAGKPSLDMIGVGLGAIIKLELKGKAPKAVGLSLMSIREVEDILNRGMIKNKAVVKREGDNIKVWIARSDEEFSNKHKYSIDAVVGSVWYEDGSPMGTLVGEGLDTIIKLENGET